MIHLTELAQCGSDLMVIRTIVVHRGHVEIENGSKDALAEIFFALFHRGRLSSLGRLTMN